MKPPAMERRQAPQTRTDDAVYHWVYFVLAAVVLILSFTLKIAPDGNRVVIPWIDYVLPESCTFKRLLGFGCPGCGLTRSFISFAHGDIQAAWRYNVGGLFFFLLVAGQIPYRLLRIYTNCAKWSRWCNHYVPVCTIWALLTLLVAQWIFRCIHDFMA